MSFQFTCITYCVPHLTTARRSYAWDRVNLNAKPDLGMGTSLYEVSLNSEPLSLSYRLVGGLTPPFTTKIGYIGDKVMSGDLVP